MDRSKVSLLLAALFVVAVTLPAAADSTVHGLSTNTTSPLPANSCVYVDQGPGTDTKLCSGYATAFGAGVVGGNNVWIGYNEEPICTLTDATTVTPALTGCASDATKGVAVYSWTLTGSGHLLNVPTGCPAAGGCNFAVRITHTSGGGDGPNLGTGFSFPLSAQTSGQPTLSTSGGSLVDWIFCKIIDATHAECGAPLLAMTAVSQFALVQHTVGSDCGTATTCTATLTVSAGDTLLVGTAWCGNSGAACTAGGATTGAWTAVPTKTGGTATIGTCVFLTNTGVGETTNGVNIKIAECPITVSGSVTMTSTITASTSHIQVLLADFSGVSTSSPDVGIGNAAAGSTTTPSITTTGGTSGHTTQVGQLVLSMLGGIGTLSAGTLNGSAPLTIVDQASTAIHFLMQWGISGASGVAQTVTGGVTSGTSVIDVAVLSHP